MQRAAVTIVGAGPVGLTLANLLGAAGVSTVLLERNPRTVDEPRAIAIDAESLRTMQSAGLYEAIRDDLLLGFDVDYVNGDGRTLFSITLTENPYGHALQNSFDQPLLERQLRLGLERFTTVEVCFEHTVQSVQQSPQQVVTRGRRSDCTDFSIESDYLIGCDGGRSLVRQMLGISMSGRTEPQRWLVIDTLDPMLDDSFACRFFCDPARPGMTIKKRHGKRRWEWMLLPGETDADLLDEWQIRSLLAPYTDVRQVKIERKCVYTFHSIVADRYREGRILLAGDAAHMMPPFAGQGMNGGIRDARNLAWKLALVTQGVANDALLDTYEAERRDHVIAATQLANQLGSFIQPTSQLRALARDLFFFAVGLTDVGKAALYRSISGSLRAPILPSSSFIAAAARPHLAGQMLVQPLVTRPDGTIVLLDEILGTGFVILGFDLDPKRELDAATRRRWESLGARLLRVGADATAEAIDHTGALAAWLGKARQQFLAVRPDKFVAGQFTNADAATQTEKILRLLSVG